MGQGPFGELREWPWQGSLGRTAPRDAAENEEVNLRRRDSDVLRREKLAWAADRCAGGSFAFPADASVLIVFENYTTIRQLLADFVAPSEVPPLPGDLPLRDQGLNLGRRNGPVGGREAQVGKLRGVVVRKDGEHLVEGGEKAPNGAGVLLAELAGVHRRVRLP